MYQVDLRKVVTRQTGTLVKLHVAVAMAVSGDDSFPYGVWITP